MIFLNPLTQPLLWKFAAVCGLLFLSFFAITAIFAGIGRGFMLDILDGLSSSRKSRILSIYHAALISALWLVFFAIREIISFYLDYLITAQKSVGIESSALQGFYAVFEPFTIISMLFLMLVSLLSFQADHAARSGVFSIKKFLAFSTFSTVYVAPYSSLPRLLRSLLAYVFTYAFAIGAVNAGEWFFSASMPLLIYQIVVVVSSLCFGMALMAYFLNKNSVQG
jgi:hypothetical protein